MAKLRYDSQHRLGILLSLLGPKVTDTVLQAVPGDKQKQLREQLTSIEDAPPSEREVVATLEEFDRLLRFAAPAAGASEVEETTGTTFNGTVHFPELPSDPFEALGEVSETRLVAALRDESPRTAAIILSCLNEKKAARILNLLPAGLRDAAVLQLKEKLTPSLALLNRLATATVQKCVSFVEQELAAESVSSDDRLAKLLRTMAPGQRAEVLQMLEEADAEACERVRGALFNFDDLQRVELKTLQRILGEVDSRSLAAALKSASDAIQDRVLSNLSKRARQALAEEISLLGNMQADEVAAAQDTIVKAMVELDRVGELYMESE